MKSIETTVKITGTKPLLMHSENLVDPLSPLKKKMSEYTGLRKKTDEDYAAIAKIEWMAGLYLDAEGRIVLPAKNLKAMIVAGAKSQKKGKDVSKAVNIPAVYAPLQFAGCKEQGKLGFLEKLFETPGFRLDCAARVGMAKVMRCRPQFREWSCEFRVVANPQIISNVSELRGWIEYAGLFCGVGDWRPDYGTFEVEFD